MPPIRLCLVLSLFLCLSCRKTHNPPSASGPLDKEITSFWLAVADEPSLVNDITGVISGDTIILRLSDSARIKHIKPNIKYTGVRLNPAENTFVDLTRPAAYTVTAADSSTRVYSIRIVRLSAEKEVISVVFERAKNPSLAEDITAVITGDLIYAETPVGIDPGSLIPTVTYKGVSIDITPITDSYPAAYSINVHAADNSVRTYSLSGPDRTALLAAGSDESLYCFNPTSGDINWRIPLAVSGRPLVSAGFAYIATTSGQVYKISVKDGSVLWITSLNTSLTLSSPVITNGRVCWGSYAGDQSGNGNSEALIWAVDTANGQLAWKDELYMPGNAPFFPATITADENYLVYQTMQSGTDVFDARTGTHSGRAAGELGRGNPLLSNGIIYCQEEMYYAAVDPSSLLPIWRVGLDPANSGTSHNGQIYLPVYDGTVVALNVADGSAGWRTRVSNGPNYSSSVAGTALNLVVYTANKVKALDYGNGSVLWSLEITATDVAAVENDLWITDDAKTVGRFDALTGKRIWKSSPGLFTGNLCVVDRLGRAHYASESGMEQ